MIKYLLFDADDTLFDFDRCESHAFELTCETHGIDNKVIYDDYKQISNSLWNMFEFNKISIAELVIERYRKLFTIHDINLDPESFNIEYLNNLGETAFLFDGAFDLCRDLSESGKYELYIVTNGVALAQTKRFYKSLLNNYFKDIFISQKIGSQKPSNKFFDYVVDKASIVRAESMIIGDSLTSDIKGGNNAGMQTCWYNPKNKVNNTDSVCDYIITNYDELRCILKI